MVTLARPPSAIAIGAMVRDLLAIPTSAGNAGARGLWPAIPRRQRRTASFPLWHLGDGTSRSWRLGIGFAAPTDHTWLETLRGRRPSYHGRTERILRRLQGAARGVGRSVADVERALAVEWVPKGKLAATLAGEGTAIFELSEAQAPYAKADGWSLVSHTFEMQADGSAVLSLMFEREASSSRVGRWWHHVAGG